MSHYESLPLTAYLPNGHSFSLSASLHKREIGGAAAVVEVSHLEFPINFPEKLNHSTGGALSVAEFSANIISAMNTSRLDKGEADGGITFSVTSGSLAHPKPVERLGYQLSRPEHQLPGSAHHDSVLWVESHELMESVCRRFPSITARPAWLNVGEGHKGFPLINGLEHGVACLAVQQAYQAYNIPLTEPPSSVMAQIKAGMAELSTDDQEKALASIASARRFDAAIDALTKAFPYQPPALLPSPHSLQTPSRYLTQSEALQHLPWVRSDAHIEVEKGNVVIEGRKKAVDVTWVTPAHGEHADMAMARVDEGLDMVSIYKGDALRGIRSDMTLDSDGNPGNDDTGLRRRRR